MKRHRLIKLITLLVFIITPIFFIFTFLFAEKKNGASDGTSLSVSDTTKAGVLPYTIASGDTLKSIAEKKGYSVFDIVTHNRIMDERILTPGFTIELPAVINKPNDPFGFLTEIKAEASSTSGEVPLTVGFATPDVDSKQQNKYIWDFGNGIYSFQPQPDFTYLVPGTYFARLAVLFKDGKKIVSKPIRIEAKSGNLKSAGLEFLVLDHINAILDLNERVKDKAGTAVCFGMGTKIVQKPQLIAQVAENKFVAIKSGYSVITVDNGKNRYTFDLFVSPYPSQFSIEPEFDWYKTQFETGIWGNCGPACVAMAVHWSTGEYITVEKSREEIGMPYPKGALSYDNMLDNFKLHKMTAFKQKAETFEDIKKVIDKGRIVIISFDTTYIRHTDGDKTKVFTHRYYPDTTGHYIVLKGYSLDRSYFIAYDPIPGDWQSNEPRYDDNVSMIGRNRFFLADEIFTSLIRDKNVLVVCKR
jgi:PKD repeat protein